MPESWSTAWGIRRYGFHGLSVAWAIRRAGELLERDVAELGLVVAHLGGGCSVTAVAGARSVHTSMGYTPLDGLMMTTRSGAIDPGVLVRLLADGRMTVAQLSDALEHRSGLLGVSGVSADVREVTAAADGGDSLAVLALEMFASHAAAGIAAAATALASLDALVFTGGIGEHAGPLRAAIVARLGVLGVSPIGDGESGEDRVLSARTSTPVRPADHFPRGPGHGRGRGAVGHSSSALRSPAALRVCEAEQARRGILCHFCEATRCITRRFGIRRDRELAPEGRDGGAELVARQHPVRDQEVVGEDRRDPRELLERHAGRHATFHPRDGRLMDARSRFEASL